MVLSTSRYVDSMSYGRGAWLDEAVGERHAPIIGLFPTALEVGFTFELSILRLP